MERMTSTLAVLGSHGTFASLVDAFLDHPKALDGIPHWTPGNRKGERRIRWPVILVGQSCGADLDLTGYPGEHDRFMIGLSFPTQIWRIDFERVTRDPHVNPVDQVERLGIGTIFGPHFHAWVDNRYLATPKGLPELDCARLMPPKIKGFPNALRWLCGETNIALTAAQMIDLPPRETLL